jgi:hypothetical protein
MSSARFTRFAGYQSKTALAVISMVLMSVFSNHGVTDSLSCSNSTIDELANSHWQAPNCHSDTPGDAQKYLVYLESNCIKDKWRADAKCKNIQTLLLLTKKETGEGIEAFNKFQSEVDQFLQRKRDEASDKSTLPACDSQLVENIFIATANNDSARTANELAVSKIKNAKQIAYNMQDDTRICSATAVNKTGSDMMIFAIKKDGEKFYVEVR